MIQLRVIFALVLLTAAVAVSSPSRFTTKRHKVINGRRMAYVEVGTGDPIVFLHGNPTSSYLWRNIMPHLEGRGRLIAPDLIGMGDSEKLPAGDPLRYTVLEHTNYLFALLEELGVKRRVTLVIHDWGSAMGFLWAFQRRFDPGAVRGIAFMEAFVNTFTTERPIDSPALFERLRTPGVGEKLILEENFFVQQLVPSLIMRNLTAEEKREYARPWLTPGESRRAMLTFPRQIPINGVPASTAQFISQYSKWLQVSDVPKLFIRARPGLLIKGPFVDFIRTWKKVKEVTVKGIHYVQEDSPDEIGRAIATWLPN